MKSSDFLYHRPASVEEAVSLLADYGDGARVLAGGQSLIPMMNMRLVRPASLIDICDLDALKCIKTEDEATVLGSLVRYRQIEMDPVVAKRLPAMAHMIRWVGDRQVRNRGTLGGSLVQADPTGEMPLATLVLRGELAIVSDRGARRISIEDFFLGSYATALEAGEILVEVRFPRHPDHFSFFEVNRRHNDFAIVSVLAVGNCDAEGRWHDLRIGIGGADETPVLARRAMQRLEDGSLSDEAIDAAAGIAAADINPGSDVRGSDEYRRHLAGVYVARALRDLKAQRKF